MKNKLLFVLLSINSVLFGQKDLDFLEVSIDFSDTSSLKKNYVIQNVKTVYFYFKKVTSYWSLDKEEELQELRKIQSEVLNRIYVENVDSLLFQGIVGNFDFYSLIKNSIYNVKNLFLFVGFGEITLLKQEEEPLSSQHFNSIWLSSDSLVLDLNLFNNEIKIKELVLSSESKADIILKGQTNQIKEVSIESQLFPSRHHWRIKQKFYKTKFVDSNINMSGRSFEFRKDSEYYRTVIIPSRENNIRRVGEEGGVR